VDLFTKARGGGQPLAERMRPRSLDEVVGQRQLLGEGQLLERLLAADSLPSLIFWGAPGTGKTTLARLIAEQRRAYLVMLSAVSAGVAQIRETVAEAEKRRDATGELTILFLDEIHRFNKAQQDALLPHVEAGCSRSSAPPPRTRRSSSTRRSSRARTVVRLEPLAPEELRTLIDRALEDRERGLGEIRRPSPTPSATRSPARPTATPGGAHHARAGRPRRPARQAPVDEAVLDEGAAAQDAALRPRRRRALRRHLGLHQVAARLRPRRRGLLDGAHARGRRGPALRPAPHGDLRRRGHRQRRPARARRRHDAAAAVRFVGLPEGVLPMTQAVIYLATAPKSNTVLTTWGAAREAVMETATLPVPPHLRNAPTKLMKDMGFGQAYQYPHNFEGNYVVEDYLPEKLVGSRFYEPSESGWEKTLKERLAAGAKGQKDGLLRSSPARAQAEELDVELVGHHGQHEVERLLPHLLVDVVGEEHQAVLVGTDRVAHDLGQPEQVQPFGEEGLGHRHGELVKPLVAFRNHGAPM
jgi:putative ATPase